MVQVHCPAGPQALKAESTQERPEQHEVPPRAQVWPAETQVFTAQVPVAAPGGNEQLAPEQQSAAMVQVAPRGWQTTGVVHTEPEQICEQQSAEKAQLVPVARHRVPASTAPPSSVAAPASLTAGDGGRHAPATQAVPAQQLELELHAAPRGEQVGGVQAKPPSAAGRQGLPSQHCSRNWQLWPVAMQQGALPVKPVGQVTE